MADFKNKTSFFSRPAAGGRRQYIIIISLLAAVVLSGCGGGPRFYLAGNPGFGPGKKLAVLPLVNLSRHQDAPGLLMSSIIVEILKSGNLSLIDPGTVENLILEKRIRLTDRLSLETSRAIAGKLAASYILIGTIHEFSLAQVGSETFPSISLSLRLIDPFDGRIIWTATHSRRGDDSETVFGLGTVKTLEQMSQIVIKDMIDTMKP